jgi:ribosome biogenesis GTPase / thiamine phosphate phosphatase
MTGDFPFNGPVSLPALGWSDFFQDQIRSDEASLLPGRIAAIHRARLTAISETGTSHIFLPAGGNTGQFAVGDWVLVHPATQTLQRRLDRRTVLERRAENSNTPQLGAANVDTLFIVTSCNSEFSLARLERYLALANEGGMDPVILLTKADTAENAEDYQRQAAALQRGLAAFTLDPRSPGAPAALAAWCGFGRTVALVGSSGVGKSSLVNRLTRSDELPQETGAVREHDSKGRHTTTARSFHAMASGGWVIDTPGMRTLHVTQALHGLEVLFAEIAELAPLCRFRDCTHAHEPGCAVQAAVLGGTVDPERLTRWRKLSKENASGPAPPTGPRGNKSVAPGRARRR